MLICNAVTETKLDVGVQTKLNQTAPTWTTLSGKPAVIAAGADQATARAVIGAGTSSLALGTTSSTAKAGDYTPTKADVGLDQVDNTSDINKPISTATQTALDTKQNISTAPSGYIRVPGNSRFGTTDFFVMKYQAKDDGSGNAISAAAGSPWVSISQRD